MARAMWTGFLSFGLVNVPVGLYSATTDQTIHFNQLHKGTSNRVRYKKVDEVTGEELEAADIVNGYPVGGGEYIVVTREEMKEAAPGKSDLIEISDFVDLDEIDPMYFRQTYYLGPRGKGADRAYSLLRQAMRETNKVGIATLVLRDKEHLVAVRPGEDALLLETMFFADEIRDASEQLDSLPEDVPAEARELKIAKQLVESLTDKWDPARYKNTYRERIEELVETKRAGHAVVFQTEQPKSNVVDLMAALEASVARTARPQASDDRSVPAQATDSSAQAERSKGHQKGVQQSFEGMSKAELLERAAELDVQGRTKMTKLQLVEALTEAESEAEAPKSRRRSAS
ncbi:MAG: putative end-binding protein Ku [Acidimicrobiaceae bacterium]|nr:putative end-binding protein Ku [Acidimicrobiaceae bacterium]